MLKILTLLVVLAAPIAASAQPAECWVNGRYVCQREWGRSDPRAWQEPRRQRHEEYWRERHQEEWWNRREWCRRHPERCY